MFKKMAIASLISISTFAVANPETLSFDLEATVPAERYYVKYDNPSFGIGPQTMDWDQTAQRLENVNTQIIAMNNMGNITAHLLDTAQLVKTGDATTTIPLTITLGNNTIPMGPGSAVEVVSASDNTEQRLDLVVAPTNSTYVDGAYTGSVSMVFDFDLTP